MKSMRAVLLRCKRLCRKKIKLQETDLSPDEYDMKGINDRVHRAINRVGKTRVEVATLYGMDASIPLAMQPPERVPRPTMENMVKLSGLLGVSVRWMLHGEPENDVDVFVMGPLPSGASLAATAATNGAAIISGASNSTVVVQNIRGDDLSGMEREMILTLRQLHPKDQAAAFSYVFALESSAAEQKEKAPST